MTKKEEKLKIQHIIDNLKKAYRIMVLNDCISKNEIENKIKKYEEIKRGI